MDWSISLVAPELMLAIAAMLVLLVDLPARRRGTVSPLAVSPLPEVIAFVALVAAGVLAGLQWGQETQMGFGGRLIVDAMAVFLHLLFIVIGFGTLLIAMPYLRREELPRAEFLSLLLFSVCGMMIMSAAAEMITFFLGLELLSMSLYILAGYQRRMTRSIEASLKYFLLGAFATAILLMGMALHWGSTGSLALSSLSPAGDTAQLHPALAQAGFWLVMVGVAFKISVVPFHFWTADVYEGSPAPVTAFMATGTKAAALAAMMRLLLAGFAPEPEAWQPLLWWLAVLTMSVGNLMALVQSNVKRMLAFSSVAHAGYLLVGLIVARPSATRAVLFYLVGYTLMNLGAFAVVTLVGRKREEYQSIYDYAGLARRQPWLAILMSVFLFSLAGIPPTIGFTGKFMLFSEAMRAGFVGLTVIAVLNSMVSVYYYLRVIYLMTMKEEWEQSPQLLVPAGVALLLAFCFVLIIWLGLFPAGLIAAATHSAWLF
jgi:NADH-quinone oxidoreductase subunit N